MKNYYYQYGSYKCHAYYKEAGHGWEVGFYFGEKQIFVGNFIHKKEATKWWAYMNREVKYFAKNYVYSDQASYTWYAKFFSTHLYRTYYSFLDQEFKKYQKTYDYAWKQDTKKYSTLKRKMNHGDYADYKFRKYA